jgi:hypothetical protein
VAAAGIALLVVTNRVFTAMPNWLTASRRGQRFQRPRPVVLS